ncbi:MAG: radical SAM protein [Deltaproteobacteria bacterium]|nr:radical SAM protein [Deltaproteobacteria bacterium]
MKKKSDLNGKPKVKVGLVQINNSFGNQNYLPYSVGLIQAYALEYLTDKERFEFLLPVYKRMPVYRALERLSGAGIIFFSAYVWNFNLSLEIARRFKLLNPDTLIVFGGPNVPGRNTAEFFAAHSFIDILCHGEGEITCLEILENFEGKNWEKVGSISYLDSEGRLVRNKRQRKLTDLDTVSSPYLAGVFEPLIHENPDGTWLALWETNRGCPFTCSYCDWGSSTHSKVLTYSLERLYREIDWFSKNRIEFVFCCDANFGIFPRDIEFVKHFADIKAKSGYPKALSVQNTKNSSERTYAVEKTMADAGLNKGVALSLQSLNQETLKHIRRANITMEHFHELQKKFSEENIETFTDLILALPCETYDSFAEGVASVIESGQHNRIQFNNLSVLPNSEMGDPEYHKKYGFVIVESKVINAHGSLNEMEEVYETQRLVVGTDTMPEGDWLKARTLGWMAALLHFDKLLQIPFIILHDHFGLSYRELLEGFTTVKGPYPVLSWIKGFFEDKAKDVQQGGSEFCASKEWLNLLWPADELVLIKLCTEGKLMAFYDEAEGFLGKLLEKKGADGYKEILRDAVYLNRNLVKLPFQDRNLGLELSYNILESYNAALKGAKVQLRRGDCMHTVDRGSLRWDSWETWCREVIWYGNKKGAYLYKLIEAYCEA